LRMGFMIKPGRYVKQGDLFLKKMNKLVGKGVEKVYNISKCI